MKKIIRPLETAEQPQHTFTKIQLLSSKFKRRQHQSHSTGWHSITLPGSPSTANHALKPGLKPPSWPCPYLQCPTCLEYNKITTLPRNRLGLAWVWTSPRPVLHVPSHATQPFLHRCPLQVKRLIPRCSELPEDRNRNPQLCAQSLELSLYSPSWTLFHLISPMSMYEASPLTGRPARVPGTHVLAQGACKEPKRKTGLLTST